MRKALLALAVIATFASCKKEGSYEKPKANNGGSNNETKPDDNQTTGTRLVKWIQGVDYLTHKQEWPDTVFTLKYNKGGKVKQININYNPAQPADIDIYNIEYEGQYPTSIGAGDVFRYDDNGKLIERIDPSGRYTLQYDASGMLLSKTLYNDNGNPFKTRTFQTQDGNIVSTSDGYTFTYTDKPNVLRDFFLLNSFYNYMGLEDIFGMNEMFASKNLPASYKVGDGDLQYNISYTYNQKGQLISVVAAGNRYRDRDKLTLNFFYE